MKIELADNHAKSPLIVMICVLLSILWSWFLGVFDESFLVIFIVLSALNFFPFLLAKQYLFGAYLRFGIDEKYLYFPARNKVVQKLPIKFVQKITLGNIENKDRSNGDDPHFIEMIYVEVETFNSTMQEQNLLPPLWGWFCDSGIAIGYVNREETFTVVSRMNQLIARVN